MKYTDICKLLSPTCLEKLEAILEEYKPWVLPEEFTAISALQARLKSGEIHLFNHSRGRRVLTLESDSRGDIASAWLGQHDMWILAYIKPGKPFSVQHVKVLINKVLANYGSDPRLRVSSSSNILKLEQPTANKVKSTRWIAIQYIPGWVRPRKCPLCGHEEERPDSFTFDFFVVVIGADNDVYQTGIIIYKNRIPREKEEKILP